MAINALRKKGARMSLKEALDRIEKLKRLTQSSNPHEAALAALRLETFDVDAARAPRLEAVQENFDKKECFVQKKDIEILEELPERPYQEMGEIAVEQSPEKNGVNWDELHFELLEKAQNLGADVIVNIRLQGTINQKILCGTALKYLNAQELFDVKQATKLEDEEKAYFEAQKERRDENTAPGIG